MSPPADPRRPILAARPGTRTCAGRNDAAAGHRQTPGRRARRRTPCTGPSRRLLFRARAVAGVAAEHHATAPRPLCAAVGIADAGTARKTHLIPRKVPICGHDASRSSGDGIAFTVRASAAPVIAAYPAVVWMWA